MLILEVFASSGEEAKMIAREVGYILDEEYIPVPDKGTWFIRGKRGESYSHDLRIIEWPDSELNYGRRETEDN